MKSFLITVSFIFMLSLNAFAATYHEVDKVFVKQAEALGVSQSVWDQPEYAAMSFPSAYKFTTYYRISRGLLGSGESVLVPQKWTEADPLDLTKLKGMDADGEHDLVTLLRDRLKNHAMVVLKGGKLVHQHFFNGMDEHSTHLEMSVTKSFVATLAGIAVSEGKLDMSEKWVKVFEEFMMC